MKLDLRKTLVGLVSLALLLAIFVLYNIISNTPSIQIDVAREFTDPTVDNNAGDFDREGGTIADVGVVTVRKSQFFHRGKNNRVDREFGFAELLHESADQWEIEKPYMNMFLPDLKCSVTADKGNVRVETAYGQAMPNDATFSGNVVIHIVPTEPGDVRESLIYLDEVVFVSKKSLFSSSGSVRFVSQSAKLVGSGLELLYDDVLDRLQLFRIISLDAVRLRSSDVRLFSGRILSVPQPRQVGDVAAAQVNSPERAGSATRLSSPKPGKPLENTSSETVGVGSSRHVEEDRQAAGQPVEEKRGESYRCVFYKNVVVSTPEQLIIAERELSISNVLWSPSSQGKTTGGAASGGTAEAAQGKTNTINNERLKTPGGVGSGSDKLYNLSDDLFDIVITCSGGVVVTPMDWAGAESQSGQPGGETAAAPRNLNTVEGTSGRTFFKAQRIGYDASSGDTVADGPVQLDLRVDSNDLTGSKNSAEGVGDKDGLPIRVTAQKHARFLSSSNRIVFEGDCIGTALRAEPNATVEHRLLAPKLTLDLAAGPGGRSGKSSAGIRQLAAEGGAVKFATVRKERGQVHSGVQLECVRLDYEGGRKLLVATGPGMVKLNNSVPSGPQAGRSGFSFRRPCYAFLRDFDKLEYCLDTGRLVADADSRQIILDYFPVVDGRYGPHAQAVVGHVEANLTETADHRTELSSLIASDGITYEDDTNQFVGGRLSYDYDRSSLSISGDRNQPCYFNGAIVDGIEIDLKTGKAKARLRAPGALQLNR